jgi:hypothetical protein
MIPLFRIPQSAIRTPSLQNASLPPSKTADRPGCPTIDRSSGGHQMPDQCPSTILQRGSARLHIVGAAPEESGKLDSAPKSVPCPTLVAAAAAGIIRPGDILHARTFTPLAWAIRRCVGSWGTHDALVVRDNGVLCIGDAAPMKCHCTPLETYQRRLEAGKVQFFVCRPVAVFLPDNQLEISGMMAAYWWIENVKGKKYDFAAYPRLFLKSIFGDICQAAAGWQWAWYCTESCRDAWRNGAGVDPWQKNNPTPRTTEKRIESGALQIVYSPMPDVSLTSAKYTQAGVNSPGSEQVNSADVLTRDAIQGVSLRKGYGI